MNQNAFCVLSILAVIARQEPLKWNSKGANLRFSRPSTQKELKEGLKVKINEGKSGKHYVSQE